MKKKDRTSTVARPSHASLPGRVTSGPAFMVDGYAARLEGEPPPASSHGWGDLSWLYERAHGGS